MTTSRRRSRRVFRGRLAVPWAGWRGGPGTTTAGTTCDAATVGSGTTGTEPDDRGDVPGWVLVTLMTAGLVSALWLVAGRALVNLFETAISHVAP